MNREDNVLIFEDTRKMYNSNPKLMESVKNSREKQQLILEKDIVRKDNNKKYDKTMEIVVSKKRSFEAAMNYKEQKICVLNFASATNPGGGVTRGSGTQEECLCRCSTLYVNLNVDRFMKEFYISHRKAKNYLYNVSYKPFSQYPWKTKSPASDRTINKAINLKRSLMFMKSLYAYNRIDR